MKPTQNFRYTKQLCRTMIQSGLVLLFVSIGNPGAAAEQHLSAARVKIFVFNYSTASRSTLAKAQREATRILSTAGFQTEWVECRVRLTAGTEQTCAADITLADIRVRIVVLHGSDRVN